MATPGWLKSWSSASWPTNSDPAQLLETYLAPLATAVFSATPRLASDADLASISRMWHLGQIAEIMSRSRDSSFAQPTLAPGSGLACPLPLTMRKQPPDVPQAGRPHSARHDATWRAPARALD